MNDSNRDQFRQGLVHRLDAIQIALDKLGDRDSEAAATIRNLAASLITSTPENGPSAIDVAAATVLQAPDGRLREAAARLMQAMRRSLSNPSPSSAILVIGGAPRLNECFVSRLTTSNRKVFCAWTAEEAKAILLREDVVFIILNLFLPDIDGRTFLTELRDDPATATIPLLVLDEIGAGDWIKDNGLLLGADGYVAQPIDMEAVTLQIRHLLRRAHHTVSGPRRDPLTGLLNRAAMRESYAQVLKTCRAADEPLSLALIAITGSESVADTSIYWDDLMQRTGLILSNSLRATDVLTRWSANEFAVLLPGANLLCAVTAAEKVQKKIEREALQTPEAESGHLRVCAGVAELVNENGLDAAMDKADKCLFAAQSTGVAVACDQADSPASRHRVLLFHELRTARLLQQLLAGQGVEIVITDSATDYFVAPPDMRRLHLVIIDEQVRGGGFNALASVRAIRTYDRVPILMLLRTHSADNSLKALELGASDYLAAPFSPTVFTTCVRRLLSRGKSASGLKPATCDVLIVDADTTMLITAATALHQHGGFSVSLANEAGDALARFRSKRPHVVLLDARLASRDGDLLLDSILAERDTAGTAIIATINENSPQATVDSIAPRVKGLIRKPFNSLSLARELEDILHIKLSEEQPAGAAAMLAVEIRRIVEAAGPKHMPVSAHRGILRDPTLGGLR